jgi:hypothetical protein
MAKNEAILVDSILEQQLAQTPGASVGDLFEQFVLEQVLKHFDLSREEIDFGWTDGSHDGGIDGFYVLVNGRLLADPSDFTWPRSGAEIQVYLITCKHHSTFQQAPLDAMLASVHELFDLAKQSSELVGKYSQGLRECRDMFVAAFRHLSLYRPTLQFSIIYASRGDTALLGESVAARGAQLKELLNSYFSGSSASFNALGAAELVELYREVKSFSLDLPVQECLTAGQEGYVVLAKLSDYCEFVRDGQGNLRRYLFDSNVRAFLGGNLVNSDISLTLSNPSAPNFWWLNNGVTILATSASLVGKTLKLRDIQIVNGLQTTESIHKHFSIAGATPGDTRTLLVKVIVSQDEGVRDEVIRATNNQTSVEPAALHATERIQRDIEEILLRHDWFYERRTNYYKNEGRPEGRIVSPLIMATGAVALLLKNPARSSKLRQKNLRTSEAYQGVYSAHFPINTWPVVAAMIRSAENAIVRSHQTRGGSRGQHLSAWRGVLSYVAVVRLLGSFAYTHGDLIGLDLPRITDAFMDECWNAIARVSGGTSSGKVSDARVERICSSLAARWSIAGTMLQGKREIPKPPPTAPAAQPKAERPEDEAFVAAVSAALPPQPWKPGVHAQVAAKLGAKPFRVSNAIQVLIARGTWMQQRDGVVYDASGTEIMRDESRVPGGALPGGGNPNDLGDRGGDAV